MNIIESTYDWAYVGTKRKQTTHCIIHHAACEACTAMQIHKAHLAKGWRGIAYHYFVTKNGSIYRGRPEDEQGGHTYNMNCCSIGICFEGNFENEYMTNAQLEAGQKLVEDIKKRYPNIIFGKHKDYNATACPGKNFPFTYVVNPIDGSPEDELGEVENYGASAWAIEFCKWAVEIGLFKGDGKGNYNWTEPMTREAQAAVLYRFAKNYGL